MKSIKKQHREKATFTEALRELDKKLREMNKKGLDLHEHPEAARNRYERYYKVTNQSIRLMKILPIK